MTNPATSSDPSQGVSAPRRFLRALRDAFHAYARWLVSLSWKRFFLLSLLLLIGSAILKDLPPFSWTYHEIVGPDLPWEAPPVPPTPPKRKLSGSLPANGDAVDIRIDSHGVRILARSMKTEHGAQASSSASTPASPVAKPASAVSSATAAPVASSARAPASSVGWTLDAPGVHIALPPGADSDAVREAIEEARKEVVQAIEDARLEQQDAASETRSGARPQVITHHYGDGLPVLALWIILASWIIKIIYKGKVQAEVQAAQATEVAESESLKRQVLEARMAAMQAQVEPHFLFNTLASIEHLIATDPPRAGLMLSHLIALLRAAMPTMREANAQATRDLGRELAMVRPYLEILKVRMEERLQIEVDVPDGLLSAEFPPMMLQSLVENAIKHGLEPKAEGGQLLVKAEIVHGKLAVSVSDTGVGYQPAASASSGTGIGLSNIRERLTLLYGDKAKLEIGGREQGGTLARITLPYVAQQHDATA